MYNIRNYQHSDYEMIVSWWNEYNEIPPTQDMMISDSSFIIESDNKSVASITLYYPNTFAVAHIANPIANPSYTNEDRKSLINSLISYAGNEAKKKGYKTLLALPYKDKIISRFKEWGFQESIIKNVTPMFKEL